MAEIYDRHKFTDYRSFAQLIDMDERDFKKIVVEQRYAFTGLAKADMIFLGLGLNLSALAGAGEINVVPAHEHWRSAERMIADAQWLAETSEMTPLTEDEMERRISALYALRADLCKETEEQRARLDRDAQRTKDRLASQRRVAA